MQGKGVQMLHDRMLQETADKNYTNNKDPKLEFYGSAEK